MSRKIWTVICVFLLTAGTGVTFSACSDDDDALMNPAPIPKHYGRISAGNYIHDVNNYTGVAHYDQNFDTWYVDAIDGNRYYITMATISYWSLIDRMLSESQKVHFSGRVFEFQVNESWAEATDFFSSVPSETSLYCISIEELTDI